MLYNQGIAFLPSFCYNWLIRVGLIVPLKAGFLFV
jgi:hypothetical protein